MACTCFLQQQLELSFRPWLQPSDPGTCSPPRIFRWLHPPLTKTQQSAQETEPESHQMSPGVGQHCSLKDETKQPSQQPLEKLANCVQ